MLHLVPAAPHQKTVLAQLVELYEHDMSEFTGDDVGTDGRFGYKYLDFYWTEPARHPFLLLTEGKLCGFVLVRLDVRSTLSPGTTTNQIAEFFIMRKYRRRGFGRKSAILTFEQFPGNWEVFQVAGHYSAVNFWRRVISDYTSGAYQETFLNSNEWHGTVQGFNNAAI